MTLFDLDVMPPRSQAVQDEINRLARSRADERGAVFTRSDVVEFMLDLAGYTADQDLRHFRLLEPSCGDGEFLLAAATRLLTSYFDRGGTPAESELHLKSCLLGVELHVDTHDHLTFRVKALLASYLVPQEIQEALAAAWLRQDDFLLTPISGSFTHVVGNPPYVRQEAVSPLLLTAYKARYATIYDRADLFVPFFERGLDLLADGGRLCFICSDRWLRNKYGGPLRNKVAQHFHVKAFVDMVDTEAFQDSVTAYPAITLITRDTGHETRLTLRPTLNVTHLQALTRGLLGEAEHPDVETVEHAVKAADPWLLDLGPGLAVLREIEDRFPSIEEAGCTIGIGVATGADAVYIRQRDTVLIEESRKVPLVMASDVRSGTVRWSGHVVVNPFEDDGRLVHLDRYPMLNAYFNKHEVTIRGRRVGQRAVSWYRTIDKINTALTSTPKLLIPDMSGKPAVAYDPGEYYPHHNLYVITADEWDLLALKTVMRSRVTELFIRGYSVKMRGGTLRYQAQYLRRLRLPKWRDLSEAKRLQLRALADSADEHAVNDAVFTLYGLSQHSIDVLNAALEA